MEFNFEKLDVWQRSRRLVKIVYLITEPFPNSERFGLVDQLRRAAVSISSNLAEGAGRMSIKEKLRFCEIAYGSLSEVMCQMILAYDLGYINELTLTGFRPVADEVGKMISGYRRYLQSLNASD